MKTYTVSTSSHYTLDPQLGQYYQIAGCVSAHCACPRWWAVFRCMQVLSSTSRWFMVCFIGKKALHVIIVSFFFFEWRRGGVKGEKYVCVGALYTHSLAVTQRWFRWIMLIHTCPVSVSGWSWSRLQSREGPPSSESGTSLKTVTNTSERRGERAHLMKCLCPKSALIKFTKWLIYVQF